MGNRYCKNSKLSDAKFRLVVKCFALDWTAVQTAGIASLNRNSVNLVYSKMRARIFEYTRLQSPFQGEIEMDESYFGARRVRGKRGRGAGGKTIVFGLLKRGESVYTQIVPDAKRQTLQAIIRGQVEYDSTLFTDGWCAYDGLVDVGYDKHFRVNHSDNEFSDGSGNHVNGIESFWSYAKSRLAKFHGIPSSQFELFLKETEFRFNRRNDNLTRFLLKLFREAPLS